MSVEIGFFYAFPQASGRLLNKATLLKKKSHSYTKTIKKLLRNAMENLNVTYMDGVLVYIIYIDTLLNVRNYTIQICSITVTNVEVYQVGSG